jgi:hypothetical protein
LIDAHPPPDQITDSPKAFCFPVSAFQVFYFEIRSLPALAHCSPRSFTFYAARSARSILLFNF